MTQTGTGRLPGLENIKQPPTLFFTLGDTNNPKSRAVVEGLKGEFADTQGVFLRVFSNQYEIAEYVKLAKVEPKYAVAIFDGCFKGKCMTTMIGSHRRWQNYLPAWSTAFWNIMVSPKMTEARVKSICHQIRVLYCQRYLEQLDRGQLPAGPVPGPRKHVERKKRERERDLMGIR